MLSEDLQAFTTHPTLNRGHLPHSNPKLLHLNPDEKKAARNTSHVNPHSMFIFSNNSDQTSDSVRPRVILQIYLLQYCV